MSILCGLAKERGAAAHEYELRQLAASTLRYGTGDVSLQVHGRIGVGLQPYCSHMRSALDSRPFIDGRGNIVCFDGRLDNFEELIDALDLNDAATPDSLIVLAAFARWGDACLGHLTGDWALAIWHAGEQRLLLARDHAGTRSLYYKQTATQLQWATYLDTLVGSGAGLEVSRSYAAAFLSCSPVRDLTPYNGIRSVRPGHYVAYHNGRTTQRPHWDPLVHRSIRYRSEVEYDEHFLSVFGRAVTRRTGPGEPVIAQLSGGMDSTAIVCMSDHLRRCIDPQAEILDTLSFFDDGEASLDEKQYFLITEQRRGKSGTHLEIALSQRSFDLPLSDAGWYYIPGCDSFSVEWEHVLSKAVWQSGYRSILSGIGGDEVLGGVPCGLPELADYMVSGRFCTLTQRALAWSLPDRTPLWATLYRTARYAAKLYAQNNPKLRPLPPWLSKDLRKSFFELERMTQVVRHRLGAMPHRLENAATWWHIMETLPHLSPQILFRPEFRYPMLDKDLVEYLFAIPPEQLVQPGRRRALMRRALRGIVPTEILERRRKAFQLRASMAAIRTAHAKLEQMMSDSVAVELGLIDTKAFKSTLGDTVNGDSRWYQAVLRTIAFELWLRSCPHGSTDAEESTLHPSLAVS